MMRQALDRVTVVQTGLYQLLSGELQRCPDCQPREDFIAFLESGEQLNGAIIVTPSHQDVKGIEPGDAPIWCLSVVYTPAPAVGWMTTPSPWICWQSPPMTRPQAQQCCIQTAERIRSDLAGWCVEVGIDLDLLRLLSRMMLSQERE